MEWELMLHVVNEKTNATGTKSLESAAAFASSIFQLKQTHPTPGGTKITWGKTKLQPQQEKQNFAK